MLVEEVSQGGGDQVRGLLGQEVAGGKHLAADIGGVLLPHGERIISATHEAVRTPQRQYRATDLLPGGETFLVVH